MIKKWASKWTPKSLKWHPDVFFALPKKHQIPQAFFFSLLLFPGRPGRRQSSNFLANTIIFAMRPFLKIYTVFYKTVSKLVPSATPKTIRNLKNLIFTTVENYVFFCYRFFHEFVGKWPPFLEVPGVTFGVILQLFCLMWLPRPHVCKKTRFFIKNDQKVSLKVDPKFVKMVSRRLFICIYIGRFGRTLNAKTTGCGDGPPQASSIKTTTL